MKTKLIITFVMSIFMLGNIAYAQQDSVDVNDILNNVLEQQKKEVEKEGREEKRIKDSLNAEMNRYLANIEAAERRQADSTLFLETKSLINSILVEKNKEIESMKDSIAKVKLFLSSELPNWYQEYGIKTKIAKLMKHQVSEIESTILSVNMTEDSYSNAGKFHNLSVENEAALIGMNDELNKLKRKLLEKEKLFRSFKREEQKQISLFEKFKKQYQKLNPKVDENERNLMDKNFEKYKNVITGIKNIEQEVKSNGRLQKTDPSIRKKLKNIFKKVDWEFKPPIGNNAALIKTALDQAKTLASRKE